MDHDNMLAILKLMKNSDKAVGALYLSERTGIPPATVGRILLSLENKKIIKKDSNKGRIITDYGKKHLEDLIVKKESIKIADQIVDIVQDVSKKRLLENIQIRVLIEPDGARMAAANCTDENARILEEILMDYAYELRHNQMGDKSDLALHTYIAKLSGNETLHKIVRLLLQKNDAFVKFSAANKLASQKILHHKELIEAIIAHDGVAAEQKMRLHLLGVMNDVEKFY